MTGRMAPCVLVVVALVAFQVALGDDSTNEPEFPKLIGRTKPNHHRIHITSERFNFNGVYTAAEEFIDLDLGKAAYIETTNNVRTTWLVNIKENTIYRYRPFNCTKYEHISLQADSPYITQLGAPRIAADETSHMFLFGNVAIIESLSLLAKRYQRTANLTRTVGDLDGSERIGHKWLSDIGPITVEVFFSEAPSTSGGQSPELSLDTIEIKKASKKTTINILSIEREFPPEIYHNELQLPLIYGCKRDAKLNAEMKPKFEILAADTATRHHLTAQARAISFAGSSPVSTEPNTIELALSQLRDTNYGMAPVQVHMVRQQNEHSDIKTVIDHHLNVKYEANLNEGTCEITNVGTLNPAQPSNPVLLTFSDELKLNISARDLDSILYGVREESFMKLEQRGSELHAYFADSYANIFGAGRLGRVVRRFTFSENGRPKLDSVAIWIFESQQFDLKLQEVYDIKIVDSKSLESDVNSADAFDMSRECYLDNLRMRNGRDYAWFELEYTLASDQREALRDRVEELKNTFYRLIRANLGLNYLRVPKIKVELIDSGFVVKILVLDSVPLHLVYDEFESFALKPSFVYSSKSVSCLYDCSEFCWENQCSGMTYLRGNHSCSITKSRFGSNRLQQEQFATTYEISDERKLELLPRDDSRLERLIKALQSNGQNVSGVLGINEFNQLHSSKNLRGFGNLRIVFKLNGQLIDLAPSSSHAHLEGPDDEADDSNEAQ